MKTLTKCLLMGAMPLTLIGCTIESTDPLLDSPVGYRMSCSAIRPVQSKDQLSAVPFNCEAVQISASLNELRDAGWRLESIQIGEESMVEKALAAEMTITVRKVY